MKPLFHEKLKQAVQKAGYRSLKSFYQKQSLSFSYEYLRQVVAGEKIPSRNKISEIAAALRLKEDGLQKLAVESKLDRKIRQHYRLPQATQPARLSEKISHYRKEGKKEFKILRMIEKLGEGQKEDLIEYLKFLKRRWRKGTAKK